MDISSICNELDISFNNLRALIYLVKSDKFRELYRESNNKDIVNGHILEHNLEKTKNWIIQERKRNEKFSTARDLRQIGKRLGIANYQFLTKDELSERIRESRLRANQASSG